MTVAKVTSKGQITLPIAVRKKLGLCSGSHVSFDPYGETYILNPSHVDPLDELEGFFNYSGPAYSVDEMNEAIRQKVQGKFSGGNRL